MSTLLTSQFCLSVRFKLWMYLRRKYHIITCSLIFSVFDGQQHQIQSIVFMFHYARMQIGWQRVANMVILSSKTRLRFLCIAASHGFGLPGALLGAGGPGEERAHGCGGGGPAVCVGRLHGEKHTPMSADLTPVFKFCCTYYNRHHCRGNLGGKKDNRG